MSYAMVPTSERKRRHEILQGKNVYPLDGRCVQGQERRTLVVSYGSLALGPALFVAFVLPSLVERAPHGWLFALFLPLLVLAAVASLSATSLRDPGILPRGAFLPEEIVADAVSLDMLKQNKVFGRSVYRPVDVNGCTVNQKFCYTCKRFRPPRTHHCSDCDNCIDRFDHHCPWVGNCIGRRNYRFFVMFLVSMTLLLMSGCGCSIYNLYLIAIENEGLGSAEMVREAFATSPVSVLATLFCGFILLPIGTLCCFHIACSITGTTTNEFVRVSVIDNGFATKNPYSLGPLRNLRSLFFGPMPASFVAPHEYMTEEEVFEHEKAQEAMAAIYNNASPIPQTSSTNAAVPAKEDDDDDSKMKHMSEHEKDRVRLGLNRDAKDIFAFE